MLFADELFLFLFLPLCLAFYFIMPKVQMKNNVLILFSLIFCVWGNPLSLPVIVSAAILNFAAGLLLQRFRNSRAAVPIFVISLILNLAMLAVFGYSTDITAVMNSFGVDISVPEIRSTIGISFFTLRNISYCADCKSGEVSAQRSFRKYLLYVSLFPLLAAGPIVAYREIADEIDNRSTSLADISDGISRFAVGAAKKLIIADNLRSAVIYRFGQESDGYAAVGDLSFLGAWYGAALIVLWIYFDFSAYSDMAIGLGRIFGFGFKENFNYPLASKSVSDLSHRWHISLTAFFEEYLLDLPIFGKRLKYIGLFAMWLLIGLWHGFSLNFILGGLFFGLFIAIETLIGEERMAKIPSVISHIYTKAVMLVGFAIFYFGDMSAMGKFFKSMFSLANGFGNVGVLSEKRFIVFVAAIILSMPILPKIKANAAKNPAAQFCVSAVSAVCSAALIVLSGAMLVGRTGSPFIF
jgi:alginate O-acetyltransferase complex protein AlgI